MKRVVLWIVVICIFGFWLFVWVGNGRWWPKFGSDMTDEEVLESLQDTVNLKKLMDEPIPEIYFKGMKVEPSARRYEQLMKRK